MEKSRKNKEFIIRYINSMAGVRKTREVCERYVTDESLIEHILFFDSVFPNYELLIDEITCEGDRVIVRARLQGIHRGEFNGIPPTGRDVLFPLVIGYEVENEMVKSHWLIADQMILMEQLGIAKPV